MNKSRPEVPADLLYIVQNVQTIPEGCERIGVDPDGEIRFAGAPAHDFYPDAPQEGLTSEHLYLGNDGHSIAEIEAARALIAELEKQP